MLVTCPHCGKVISSRQTSVDDLGFLKCECGSTIQLTELEPSRMDRLRKRVGSSLFGGLVAAFLGSVISWHVVRNLLKLDERAISSQTFFGLMTVGTGLCFLIGAVLGERFLNWLMRSFAEISGWFDRKR
jgi:hypothetical protein